MSKAMIKRESTHERPSHDGPHPPELQQALGRLEEALREDAAGSDCAPVSITAALWPLRPAFEHHVEATEADGRLFPDIVGRACWLAPEVERLRGEHVGFRARLAHLMEPVENPTRAGCADAQAMRRIREEAPGLVEDFVAHRQREARLMFEAYLGGIGGD